jgi:hypothetical protein
LRLAEDDRNPGAADLTPTSPRTSIPWAGFDTADAGTASRFNDIRLGPAKDCLTIGRSAAFSAIRWRALARISAQVSSIVGADLKLVWKPVSPRAGRYSGGAWRPVWVARGSC